MKAVIDTNIFIQAVAERNALFPIYGRLLRGEYDLIISSEIFLEYREILSTRGNPDVVVKVLRAIRSTPNVLSVDPTYNWRLIQADPDDDKFVDAAVAGNADYLVTDDKHFNRLKHIEFPKLKVVRGDDFLDVLASFKQG